MSSTTILTGTLTDATGAVFDANLTLKAHAPPPPPPPKETPDGTVVLLGSAATLIFASGNVASLSAAGVIAFGGKPDTVTQNCVAIGKMPGQVLVQRNAAGAFYTKLDSLPAGQWTQVTAANAGPLAPAVVPVVPPVPGTGYRVSGGRILGLDGKDWVAKGMAVLDDDMAKVPVSLIQSLLPKCNCIRLAVGGDNAGAATAQPMPAIVAWVTAVTAQKIVVVIESHITGQVAALTGAALAAESAWYAQLATTFKSNPYVMFASENEVNGGVSANHAATYKAIRDTGNNTIILFTTPNGNPIDPNNPGMDAAVYHGMSNVGFEVHFYNWITGFSTDQAAVDAKLTQMLSDLQGFTTTADGKPAVAVFEFGMINYSPGADGNVEVNGAFGTDQVADAVLRIATTHGSGYAFWMARNPWNYVSSVINKDNNTISRDGAFVAARM